MAAELERQCPDCRGPAREIMIRAGGFEAYRLEYALPDAKPNFWSSRIPAQGTVSAYLCDQCRRVLFYGNPQAES
jgi:hypothetical protein